MSGFTDEVLSALVKCQEQNEKLDEEFTTRRDALAIPFRVELEKLLVERQPLVDKLNWAQVLDSPDAPTKKLLNGNSDVKILRAIESFRVETSVRDGQLVRKVVIGLRPNMFLSTLSLFREIDGRGVTTSISGASWKPDVEKCCTGSIFQFFDEKTKDDSSMIDTMDAFDMVFQSPYLFLSSN